MYEPITSFIYIIREKTLNSKYKTYIQEVIQKRESIACALTTASLKAVNFFIREYPWPLKTIEVYIKIPRARFAKST